MSRRFLTQPDKSDGWKRLQRYSGEVSGDPFFLRHDTFIRVTSNTEDGEARQGRNFTIKRRAISEQRQNIQVDGGSKEVFDPRANLKKTGVDNLEKFKEEILDDKRERKKGKGVNDTSIERRNSKKVIKKKKKNPEKNAESGKLDELSESVKVREQLINDTADARPEDSETLGAEKSVNANETDELDDKRDKAVESETVALAGQSIEIVIDEAPNDDIGGDINQTDAVPPTPDIVRSSKSHADTGESESNDNEHENVTDENLKSHAEVEREKLIGELMNLVEEARRAAQLVETNVKIAIDEAIKVEDINEASEDIDIDSVFAAANESQLKSMESKVSHETIQESFAKAKAILNDISSEEASVNIQTPDLVRSSKIEKHESDSTSTKATTQSTSLDSLMKQLQDYSEQSVSIVERGEFKANSAKEKADSLFATLQEKEKQTSEEKFKAEERKDKLIKLITQFYEKVEEARTEATMIAENANIAAEKADIAENIKNLVVTTESKLDDIDIETVIEASETSKSRAMETKTHSNNLQEIVKEVLDLFEEISSQHDDSIATPDIVRSIKISCQSRQNSLKEDSLISEECNEYDLIKDCEACICELTTIEEQAYLLNEASENSAQTAKEAADELLTLSQNSSDNIQTNEAEEEEKKRLEEEIRLKAEEEEMKRLEEEARLKAEEEEKKRLEEEAIIKAEEEEKKRLEEEARLKAEEEEKKRLKAEEDEKNFLEEEAKLRAEEEEKIRLEEEARLKAEEEEKNRLEEEARIEREKLLSLLTSLVEESKRTEKLVEENVQKAVEESIKLENINEETDGIDVDSLFAIANESEKYSMESKIGHEIMKGLFEEARQIYSKLSSFEYFKSSEQAEIEDTSSGMDLLLLMEEIEMYSDRSLSSVDSGESYACVAKEKAESLAEALKQKQSRKEKEKLRLEEEERNRAEEEERRRLEEEERMRLEEEERKRLEEEGRHRLEEEERKRLEEEERKRLEDEEKKRLAEEERRRLEEEERERLEEEERKRLEEEERKRLEEEERKRLEEEERKRLEEEERNRIEEEERKRLEEEERKKIEEEERMMREEEERKRLEEEDMKRLVEAKLKAEQEELLRLQLLEEEKKRQLLIQLICLLNDTKGAARVLELNVNDSIDMATRIEGISDGSEDVDVDSILADGNNIEIQIIEAQSSFDTLQEAFKNAREIFHAVPTEDGIKEIASLDLGDRLEVSNYDESCIMERNLIFLMEDMESDIKQLKLRVETSKTKSFSAQEKAKSLYEFAQEKARLRAEEEARIKAEEQAKQRALEEARKKIAEEEEIARRIAEAERRVAEQERLREIERVERLRLEEEERRMAEMKRKVYEENVAKYERLIADEAETVAGEEPPAFFGGRKFEQIENIKAFLRNVITLDQFIESPNSFQSKIKALMSGELSKEAIELFPGINVANFLTITTGTLEKNDIETIIEISDKCQENNHLRSVLHVDANKVDTEESFNLIADLIDQKKLSDSNVAIVCEKGPNLAAALSLTHPIKYDGHKTSKAAQIVLKKRPNAELDERLMAKLKKWEWKVRKERMLRRSVEVAASHLPLMSVVALFWLGIRMLQEKVEREHRRERQLGDCDYFDIIRWP